MSQLTYMVAILKMENDCMYLYIKYVDGYKYWLCEYETKTYSLLSMKAIDKEDVPFWYRATIC